LTGGRENAERYSNGRPSSTNPPTYFSKIAHLISKLYPKARKIIEVGVGRSPYTLLQLKSLLRDSEIIAVDIDQDVMRELNQIGIRAIVNDIFKPHWEIYEGADLIYSIRPPFEFIPRLAELGRSVGADVIVVPLSEDEYFSNLSMWERLKEGEVVAYLLRRSRGVNRR